MSLVDLEGRITEVSLYYNLYPILTIVYLF